jgi:hypothetical protein
MREKYDAWASEPEGHWARKRRCASAASTSTASASTKIPAWVTPARDSPPASGRVENRVTRPAVSPAKVGHARSAIIEYPSVRGWVCTPQALKHGQAGVRRRKSIHIGARKPLPNLLAVTRLRQMLLRKAPPCQRLRISMHQDRSAAHPHRHAATWARPPVRPARLR